MGEVSLCSTHTKTVYIPKPPPPLQKKRVCRPSLASSSIKDRPHRTVLSLNREDMHSIMEYYSSLFHSLISIDTQLILLLSISYVRNLSRISEVYSGEIPYSEPFEPTSLHNLHRCCFYFILTLENE